MADYSEPDYVDRRLRFFDGQFLREQDFIDEQRYHLDRERRLARIAHTPGVIEGLAVTAVPNAPKVTVAPGTALDGHGRLLVRVDAGEPLDLTDLVNRDGAVTVVVGLTYVEAEADAPQGGGSPRWRESPRITAFLEGARDAPPLDVTPRLARVTLTPDGTAGVEGTASRSGLAVRGALTVTGPASFPGGIDGGPSGDGSPTQVRAAGGLRVSGDPAYDSSVRLDVTNGSGDFGRANLVITGRFQDGNDGWNFGTGARTSVVFSRNTAAHGEAVGALGEEQASLQLEGNSRSLGILTRDRGADPAVVIAQDGGVRVGSEDHAAVLDVQGDLVVAHSAALGELGRWSAAIAGRGPQALIEITLAPGSHRNLIVLRKRAGVIGPFVVNVPDGTAGQWLGKFTCYDTTLTLAAPQVVLSPGVPLGGNGTQTPLPGEEAPIVLVLEVNHITTLAG